MPVALPAIRWMSFRKFFDRMTPDGKVIDPTGLRYADIHEWLFDLAARGEDLPDFPHAGPAKDWKPAMADRASEA